MPDLEDRVAALEAAVTFPFTFGPAPSLTEAQETELRESIEEASQLGPHAYRIPPSVPPPLTAEQICYLLRECVTVVKPGETLVVRVPLTWTPDEVFRYQRNVNDCHDEGYIPFKVLIIGGEELAIAEPGVPADG